MLRWFQPMVRTGFVMLRAEVRAKGIRKQGTAVCIRRWIPRTAYKVRDFGEFPGLGSTGGFCRKLQRQALAPDRVARQSSQSLRFPRQSASCGTEARKTATTLRLASSMLASLRAGAFWFQAPFSIAGPLLRTLWIRLFTSQRDHWIDA